jgi:6-phosphogluconolactonase
LHLLPAGYTGTLMRCDTVISKDGKSVYFANRGNNSIYLFHADEKTGSADAGIGRFDCGGKDSAQLCAGPDGALDAGGQPGLEPDQRLCAQSETGVLAKEGKSFAAATPMCILFE